MKKTTYKLASNVKNWLAYDEPDDCEEEADGFFDNWLEKTEARDDLIVIDKILVDPGVLKAHFDCVPERCAPWAARGRFRSCCADIYVSIGKKEIAKLRKNHRVLDAHLSKTEPRLKKLLDSSNGNKKEFFLDEDGDALCRPGGRCVFSLMDKQARLRCRLYTVAKKQNMEITDIQPFTCRIFPLIIVQLDGGRVLLTVLDKKNYKAFESHPPSRFPCLSDPKLPPLVKSMSKTLDWMFGKGFAKVLQKRA
jgi:Fe-S-cluster containining protein